MNKGEIQDLLAFPEGTWLDWKRDFPAGLAGGSKDPKWHEGRGEVIKDILGVANGSDNRDTGYVVYGVKDLGTNRKIFGLTKPGWDDATFQQWLENTTDPVPRIAYAEFEIEPGKIVGAFKVWRMQNYPHVVVQDVGGVVHDGQVWYRRGSKNTIAHSAELRTMLVGDQPFRFSTSFDPKLKEIEQSVYDEPEWEPARPMTIDKEARIASGYEVVYYPGTRREIWVGGPGQETILMRRKKP